jgi:hypothetical protein
MSQLEGDPNQQIFAATLDIRRDLGNTLERDALATELATILSSR